MSDETVVLDQLDDLSELQLDTVEAEQLEFCADVKPEAAMPVDMERPPAFVQEINAAYRSTRAHVFVLYGNIYDYPDASGVKGSVPMALFKWYDTFWLNKMLKQEADRRGVEPQVMNLRIPNIACHYTIPNGLVFATEESFQLFKRIMQTDPRYAMASDDRPMEQREAELKARLQPRDLPSALILLHDYFELSKQILVHNRALNLKLENRKTPTMERLQIRKELENRPEANLTVLWSDSESCFPDGNLGSLAGDRTAISYIKNWALDGGVASRNKVILITDRLNNINAAIRDGVSRVLPVRIPRPDIEFRKVWLEGFQHHIQETKQILNGQVRTELLLDDDLNLELIANNTEGMALCQIEAMIVDSWNKNEPMTMGSILTAKNAAVKAQYGDILELYRPDRDREGFKTVGGHNIAKELFRDSIVIPLRLRSKKTCSRGALMVGPPGTGKTQLAKALAAECGMNFIEVKVARLFGQYVGQTEGNFERLLEALDVLAPAIVFMDELESSGLSRQTSGDSGVGARLFNGLMQFFSDGNRRGKIVILAATNRPDLLEDAFIRSGRFDDIVPILPPAREDSMGRATITKALCEKLKIFPAQDAKFLATRNSTTEGLGRLFRDSSRIWTGAEIEVLIQKAQRKAVKRLRAAVEAEALQSKEAGTPWTRSRITDEFLAIEKNARFNQADWDAAFDTFVPRTKNVEMQINLGLYYCNDKDHVPDGWKHLLQGVEQKVASYTETAGAAEVMDRS